MKLHYPALLIAASLLLGPLGALADHHESDDPGLVAKVWTFVPKAGSGADFEEAFAKHVQWRRDNGDPWTWEVYVQVDGPKVGTHYARSGNHHWSDFDQYEANEFSAKAGEHWQENVAPHLVETSSTISEWMPEISHWSPESKGYQLYTLQITLIKPGHFMKWKNSVQAIADILKEAEWPYEWGFDALISGGKAPSATLVLPARNWADMADPDPSLWDVMVEAVGEDKAGQMFEENNATKVGTEVIIVRKINELTVEGAE